MNELMAPVSTETKEIADLDQQWVDIEMAVHAALISKYESVREASLQHYIKMIEATLKSHAARDRKRLEAVENLIRAFTA